MPLLPTILQLSSAACPLQTAIAFVCDWVDGQKRGSMLTRFRGGWREGKLSRAVLRGGGGGNATSLPGLPGERLPGATPTYSFVRTPFRGLATRGLYNSIAINSDPNRWADCIARAFLPVIILFTVNHRAIAEPRAPVSFDCRTQ